VSGIGLLPGSLSVHLDGESERLPVYEEAVATGALPAGYAADDGAALVYHGTRLAECVCSRRDARVVRVTPDGGGGAVTSPQPLRLLPHAAAGVPDAPAHEPYGVSEIRALRAGRHRWD
jgi:hypothetical protein